MSEFDVQTASRDELIARLADREELITMYAKSAEWAADRINTLLEQSIRNNAQISHLLMNTPEGYHQHVMKAMKW